MELITLYEILGGNKKTDAKNNVLKSLEIYGVRKQTVSIEAEPYDYAYDTNDMDKTMAKIARVLDRREEKIFSALNKYFGTQIVNINITFFDDMSVCGGCTKRRGEVTKIVC